MSTLKVGGIRGVSASSDAITVANDGSCTANITNNLSNRNLIINGAMQVAQRGTSSTDQSYGSLDRFKIIYSGTDEAPTHSQADVAAGTTPYTLGFRKAYKITNGNQTSGAGAGDRIELQTNLEGQDLAQSGWNYVSDSSFITLSFWIKSSVAQSFASRLQTQTAGGNGSTSRFKFNFALSADTWTKVTKTIPGNSNLAFTTDNQNGFRISFYAFMGTDFTDSTTATDVWANNAGGDRADDMTSTWYTTNDATLEITGVQLEVGSVATDFEHRSFAQELALCQRYYFRLAEGADHVPIGMGSAYTSSINIGIVHFPCKMRANPSVEAVNASNYYRIISNGSTFFGSNVIIEDANSTCTGIRVTGASGVSQGTASYIRLGNALAYVAFNAEL
jgi:hypothetical protein